MNFFVCAAPGEAIKTERADDVRLWWKVSENLTNSLWRNFEKLRICWKLNRMVLGLLRVLIVEIISFKCKEGKFLGKMLGKFYVLVWEKICANCALSWRFLMFIFKTFGSFHVLERSVVEYAQKIRIDKYTWNITMWWWQNHVMNSQNSLACILNLFLFATVIKGYWHTFHIIICLFFTTINTIFLTSCLRTGFLELEIIKDYYY